MKIAISQCRNYQLTSCKQRTAQQSQRPPFILSASLYVSKRGAY